MKLEELSEIEEEILELSEFDEEILLSLELSEKELSEIEEGEEELSEIEDESFWWDGISYGEVKWKELKKSVQESLLRTAIAYDEKTGNIMEEDGECLIDLGCPCIIPGKIEDGEIIIDENTEIPNRLFDV